ncbi:MAG: CoA transferase [Pseudomonadales bacterium]|jgi:crotonobetainyl-CoA:carnitine CoA-transferase CaiB-like acyl-CoA transferase|nr:CoA transferase [Pseudomonadales bacterium]
MTAPLAGVSVIEIDNWMAAPSAGAILADLGAEVIKIEPLRGDPMRGMGRPPKIAEGPAKQYDYGFDVDNRGKRSVAVDLTQEAGQEIVRRLVTDADVFLCNLLRRRQERFGLDPDALLARNPRLVHATLTGYGTEGPEAWRPGYDVTAFFGRSGLYDAMREGEDGYVPMARPAQGDHTTGLALVAGILAALRQAERTGEGQAVETSLYETAVWTQATDFAVTAVDRAPVRRRRRHQMISATANRYPCGDGRWIVINMPEPSAWPRFVEAIGMQQWLEDERFRDMKGRFDNMAEIVDGIDAALAAKARDEWGRIFDEAGIIWGPVLSLDEVASDPQAHAIGLFPEIEHETIGRYRTVAVPMRFSRGEVGPRGPAPGVGDHTRAVLIEHGFEASELDTLLDRGIVGAPVGSD